jgi:SAM-dependent methyltransferase
MRKSIKDFIQIVSSTLPISGPIYEFGAFQVETQEGFADLRPFFPNIRYIGADMREGPGVDIVLNLHDINLPDESVGTALCLETLEHVEYPHKAIKELHRVLIPDGMVVISSLMFFPIHEFPHDYWRFTPEAFRSLLKPFNKSFVGSAGDISFPHTVIGIGFKGQIPDLTVLEKKISAWAYPQNPDNIGFFQKAYRLITPPIIYTTIKNIRETTTAKTRNEK